MNNGELVSSPRGSSGWLYFLALAVTACAPNLHAQNPNPNQRAIEALQERVLPLFEIAGVVYTDVDEATGRLKVGVLDRDIGSLIRERVPFLGVSSQSIDIVETEPIVQMATLRDSVRPLVGGLQIRFSNYLCTLGFPAVRGGRSGFVTNSHCTTKQGGVEGTLYYQPLNQVQGEFIGKEIADPVYFKNNGCPRGRVCRYSDSAFVELSGSATSDFGQIAKTTGVNNGSLTIAETGSTRFTIKAVGSVPVNSIVNKVGRTTGWTQGRVTNRCANVSVSGSTIVQLCQDIVQNSAVQIVGSGDSGSQVFAITSGDDVKLVGLLWGGNTSGTMFIYSPIENVQRQQELGTLTVY